MKKAPPALIEKIKPFVVKYRQAEDTFSAEIAAIEEEMAKATGIKDIEFFISNGLAGVGNASRSMKLINIFEIEDKNEN